MIDKVLTSKAGKVILLVSALIVLSAAAMYASSSEKSLKLTNDSSTEAKAPKPGELRPCNGNPDDLCASPPSVDLYPAGSESATNPELRNRPDDEWNNIGGVVTKIAGKTMWIRTSSGREVTINFPFAVQDWWNKEIGPDYGGYMMGVDDTLDILYAEKTGAHSSTINTDQIVRASLMIDPAAGSQPIRRYPGQ